MSCSTPELNSEKILLEKSIIVRAGAGAGKTTALTEQVLGVAREFYKKHDRYPRMVVTTFTKKATQELKERLVLLALQKDKELLEFVNSTSVLKISTIHGILDQFLRQYGSFIMLDPSFTVINSSLASQLARQVIRRILLNHEEKEVLQSLIDDFTFNKLEKLCREYAKAKLQFFELSPHDQSSLDQLMQLQLKSYAGQLDELASAIRSEENNPKWLEYARQLHIFAEFLRKHQWSDSFEFLKNFFEEMPNAIRSKNIQISEETAVFKKTLSEQLRNLFKEERYQPESLKLFAEKFQLCRKLFEAFCEEFAQLKLQTASIEINDLELFSLKLSREFPEAAKAFSDEWDYWLIDEYQDTSPVQVELIEKLSQAKPQYVVGDPQQSIYLFRGARSEVFQNRESVILAGGGERHEKIQNYRSKPELLEFFNDFFSRLKISFSPMIANWKTEPPRTKAQVAKFFIAGGADEASQEDDEVLAIIEHIEGLLNENCKLEDICILARTNKNLVEISKQLSQFGILNYVHISSGFYQRREVQDALALYKFLVHPHSNLNLLILLRSPWFSVGEQFLVDHLPKAKDSYWMYLSKLKSELPGLEKLTSYLERVQQIGLGSAYLESLLDCGIFDLSHYADHSGRIESNLWKLISILKEQEQKPGFNPLDLIAQIESDARAEMDAEGDAVPCIEPDRINLMTIHSSKGLQFRHVIIARMNKKPKSPTEPDFLFDEDSQKWSMKIPLGAEEKWTGSIAEKAHIERTKLSELAEHARVLYVAMTRAIDSVFLSWTNPIENNSWADLMRWDLSNGEHQAENYTYQVLTAKPQPQILMQSKVERLQIRPPVGVSSSAGERSAASSVTALLENQSSKVSQAQEDPSQWLDHFKLVSHGSLTHKLMQALKYSHNVDALIDRWFQTQKSEVHQALNFLKSLNEPPLMKLIEEGHVEMGFSYREDKQIIDGQIDLWGIVEQKVWIVDYKTGSIRYKDKAFSQLEYYAKALLKSKMIAHDQSIHLSVIYPFSEKLFNKTFRA